MGMESTQTSEWLTVEQAAQWLHTSKWTVERRCEDHQLPAIRLGRQWRVLRDEVIAKARANVQGHGEAHEA